LIDVNALGLTFSAGAIRLPRYHLNIDHGAHHRDNGGVVLPDLEAARREALRYSCEQLGALDDRFWTGEAWTLEVTDAAHLMLFQLTFIASNAPSIAAMSGPRCMA
jgi:hypothetical protein